MRRLRFAALVLWLALSLGATVWTGHAVWSDQRDNGAIRALAGGRDAALAENGDPRATHARILYMAWRSRLEEAQDLLSAMSDAPPVLQSEAHYAIGNARMRLGYEQLESNAFDVAESEISLAKLAYRQSLQADPQNLAAKVNLEIAMRLVRDLPRPEADGDEDPENQPRRLWTDLPGLPRGAP